MTSNFLRWIAMTLNYQGIVSFINLKKYIPLIYRALDVDNFLYAMHKKGSNCLKTYKIKYYYIKRSTINIYNIENI